LRALALGIAQGYIIYVYDFLLSASSALHLQETLANRYMNRIIHSSRLIQRPCGSSLASKLWCSPYKHYSAMMTTPALPSSGKPRYIEIGINLTDPVYSGSYHGTQRHDSDLSDVIQRAVDSGCSKLIVTASDLSESHKAVELARTYRKPSVSTICIGNKV